MHFCESRAVSIIQRVWGKSTFYVLTVENTMKIRSLLLAASMSAIMAGAAHANPLAFDVVNTDGTNDNAQEQVVNLALEANDMISEAYFEFEISDVAGAEFNSGENLDIVVTLPEGVKIGTAGASSTDVVNGTSGSVTGSNLLSGGAPGDDNVRYSVSLDPRIGRNNHTIGFHMPLALDLSVCGTADKDEPGSYSLKVEITTLNDADMANPLSGVAQFGGIVEGDDAIILQCVDGIVADVDSDEASNDTRVALSNYNTFLPNFVNNDPDDASQFPLQGTGSFDQGQVSLSPIGTINYSMDTDAVIKMGPTTGTNNLLDSSDVESLGFTIQWEDVTGMARTGFFFPGFGLESALNDSVTNAAQWGFSAFGIDQVLTNGVTTVVLAASDIAAEIEEQDVSVIDSYLTFTSASMGVSEFDDDLCGNGPLDTLQRQGRRFGFFDWVGEDKAVKNVFRISGLPTDATGMSAEDVQVDLLFRNSRGGPAFDGRKRLVIPASDISNGVVSINSDDFDAVNPGHDQSDVLILIQNTSRDIDVDRLQIDRAGSLNNFGDGANFGLNIFGEVTPAGDGDAELGSE